MATKTRGIRKVSENVLAPGRAIIITEKDKDKYKWGDIPVGSKFIDTATGIEMVKLEGESDWVPAGVKNDGTICISKDSVITCEIYTITEIDKDKRTFRYHNEDGEYRNSTMVYDEETEELTYLFKVEKGDFQPGRNLLQVTLNDALTRSAASGGLVEITNRHFGFVENLEVGDELTVIYIHKINIGNPYPRIFYGGTVPVDAEDGDLWLDTSSAPYNGNEIVEVQGE